MIKIKESAIFSNGKIYTGKRHYDCLKKINIFGKRPDDEIQGFVDTDGKFYNRSKALGIVLENNQNLMVSRSILERHTFLYSEDLY